MIIEIAKNSGFCFGVRKAIDNAEELLEKGETLYCLGDIVHNHEEVQRLTKKGMHTVQKEEGLNLKESIVLLRSHGEPPTTYQKLKENNNRIVDATCPVVLKLQERVKKSYVEMVEQNGQLVIFGKKDHPEVLGLNGQTGDKAIIITSSDDLKLLDYNRPIELYSQTTMPLDVFQTIGNEIRERAKNKFLMHDTVCRQVSNRVPQLKAFAQKHDIILFVSGKKSSNGKFLFGVCLKNNPSSYFISSPAEIDKNWFNSAESIGICGATSTPQWLMQKVEEHVRTILNNGE